MKKLLLVLAIFLFTITRSSAEVVSYDSAMSSTNKTPVLMLIYADWASDSQACMAQFKRIQEEYGDKFKYVELDVASSDMAAFNAKHQLIQGVPYMMMFRSGGMVSRNVTRDCVKDYSCLKSRVSGFVL